MAETQYEDRPYLLKGGMIRHLSTFKYVNAGFHMLKGVHGDDEEALTKVSGSELFSVTSIGGRTVGIFQVVMNGLSYYFAMANGKVMRIAGATVTDLLTGQAAGYYDGEVLQSIFYFTSGVNANKKILSSLIVQDVGIEAPPTALTGAPGAAGVLTGTYTYKYTFKNSETEHESDPSPVSAEITPTGDLVELENIAVSADPQVDKKVIYRNVNGVDGIWQRVDEIDNADTVYEDNTADEDLGEDVRDDNGVPPQARFIELYNGMMCYAGLEAPNANRVAISGVLRPEACDPDHFQDLEPDEQQAITGMKKMGSALAVHKRNRIFLGVGQAPDEIEFVPTRVKEGSLGNRGIIDYASSQWYLGGRGPFVFAGLREEFIGRPIQDFYKTLEQSMLANASGVFYEPLNMLIWNVMAVGESEFNTWLCYNVQTKEWTIRDHTASYLSIYFDTINTPKLWLGGSDGHLYTGDTGTGDNGENIAVEVTTRGICLKYINKQPDLEQTYNFRHIEIMYDANGGVEPVTVTCAVDKPTNIFQSVVNAATGLSTFIPTTGTRARFDLNLHGRLLFIKLTTASAEALVIRGIRIQGHALGRR